MNIMSLLGLNTNLKLKLLWPILLVTVLVIGTFGVYSYNTTKTIILDVFHRQIDSQFDNVMSTIQSRLDIMNITRKAMDEKNIALNQSVARIIALDNSPAALSLENMTKLAKELRVSEIHVVDENGILTNGNIPAFYGFDFKTSEQTKPFLPIIQDKSLAIAQEPMIRGTDKNLFQYISVARLDKPGIIQIGLEPREIQELLSKMDMRDLAKKTHIGKNGYVGIVSKDGVILAHPSQERIGENISDSVEWGKEILIKDKGTLTYADNGEEKFVSYKKIGEHVAIVVIPMAEISAYVTGLKTTVISTLIIAAVLLVLVISGLVSRLLVKPLGVVLAGVQEIAGGDLVGGPVQVTSKDELGRLAQAVNEMKNNLSGLVRQVAGASEQVAASSQQLTASADSSAQAANRIAAAVAEISGGTTEQLQSVEQAAGVVEQMVASIKEVADNIQHVTNASVETANKAQFGGNTINSAVSQMTNIEQTVTSSALVVAKLGERSQEIGQIVDTIASIAGQTNLLALNAAIEAARAGEQGRGFAVVADEVRKLAEQSQEAAKQISALIKEIQSETNLAVTAMSAGTKEVKIGTEVVNSAGETFKQIIALVNALSGQVTGIAAAIQEIASGSRTIVDSVQTIDQISNNVTRATQAVAAVVEKQSTAMTEIASSSESLAGMAQELQASVGKFRL